MTVLEVDAQRALARCRDEDGAQHTVETALVDPVGAGEVLLVHAGTAIARLPSAAGAVLQ
jgi:hydrogenase maturation factor